MHPPVRNDCKKTQRFSFHSSPEDAGKIFAQIHPKLAVYSHIILLTDNPSVPPPSVNDLIVRTQKVYKGPFQVGEDLLIIEVGDEVKAEKFHGAKENL